MPACSRPLCILATATLLLGCGDKTLKPINTTRPSGDGGGTGLNLPDGGGGGGVSAPTTTCATATVLTQRTPVDLLFLVDVGPGIHEPFAGGTTSKFLEARKALLEFVMGPRTAGLGVGLQFFPYGYIDKPCVGFRDCGRDSEQVLGGTTTYSCTKDRLCTLDGKPPGSFVQCPGMMTPGPCTCFLADLCKNLSGGMPTTCTEVGQCAISKKACYQVGMPCPDATADGKCEPVLGKCNFPGPSCDPTMYETPIVPIADLPGGAQPFLEALNLTDVQGGFTSPLSAAVKGSLTYLRKRATMPGARPAALVLVTEGKAAAETCSPADPLGATAELETAARGTPLLPTYVVGVLSEADRMSGRDNLNRLATAGGTTAPIVIDSAENVVPRLNEALEKVRNLALPCELNIPGSQPGAGPIDYTKVNLTITSQGMAREIGYVARMDACRPDKGGWYYDTDPMAGKPSRIRLCPTTCEALKGDTSARADLVLGCATRTID